MWHFFLFLPHFILSSLSFSLPQLVLFSFAVHTKPPTFLFPKLFLRVRLLCVCLFVCFSILIRERKEILKKKKNRDLVQNPRSWKLAQGVFYFISMYTKSVSGFRFCLLCVFLSSLVELVLKMCILLHQFLEVVIFLLEISCCFVQYLQFESGLNVCAFLLQSKKCVISE